MAHDVVPDVVRPPWSTPLRPRRGWDDDVAGLDARLEDDAEELRAAGPRRRRWLLAGLAGVLALTAVVVLGLHLAATPTAAPAAAATSPTTAAASAAAKPPEGPVVLRADLTDIPSEGGTAFDPLVVGTEPLQGGAAPDRVPNFDTCTADPATLQYLPVQIRVPQHGLSATFTVQTTASTPAGIGRLGFFFQAGGDSTPCPNGTWSTSDTFEASNMGQQVITGYAVLDQAFTPSTPQGRPDVFRSLQLRISDIRYGDRRPIVSAPTVGSLCPGAQRDLCAPLG